MPPIDDDLTPAEKAYLTGRGNLPDNIKVEDLDRSPGAQPGAPPVQPGPQGSAPAAQPAPQGGAAPAAGAPQAQPGAGGATPPAGEFDTDDDSPEAEALRKAGKTPKRVNYNKYARTQAELETTRAELAKVRESSTRVDERLRILNEALTATPPTQQQQSDEDADPAPDPEADIFGYVRWQGRQMERLTERLQGYDERDRQANAERELSTWYQGEAASFAQREQSFPLAYVYLIQNRLRELEAGGVTDQRERDRIVLSEERSVVEAAKKAGRSPAESIFALARGRGFDPEKAVAEYRARQNGSAQQPAAQPGAAPAAPGTPLGGTPNQNPGSGAQPGGQQQQQPSVTAEIERIKTAMPAATSLSSGGGVPADQLTAQMLADMSDTEFSAVVSRMSKSRAQELFGR